MDAPAILASLIEQQSLWGGLLVPQSSAGEVSAEATARPRVPKVKRRQPLKPKSDNPAHDLEKELQDKLAAVERLTADQNELKERALILEMVVAAHEDMAARVLEVQSGTLKADPFQLLNTSIEDVRTVAAQGILDKMKKFQLTVGKELLSYELTGQPSDNLKRLGKGMVEATKYLPLFRPDFLFFYSLHVDSPLDDGAFGASADAMPRPPPDHWRKVAEAAKLPPGTLKRLAILWRLAHGWIERVQSERRTLTAALQQVTAQHGMARYTQPARRGGYNPSISPMQQEAQMLGGGLAGLPESVPEEAIVKRLEANMEREMNITLLLTEIMYTRLFTEIESLQVTVHSYPFVADDMSLLKEFAQLHEEAQAAKAAKV